LLKGKRVAVDSSPLEANAAMKSIVRKATGESWKKYVRRLAQEEGDSDADDDDARRLDRRRKKRVSNREWESKSDPDARIARMKDGRTRLAYKAEHVVDLDSGIVISGEIHPQRERILPDHCLPGRPSSRKGCYRNPGTWGRPLDFLPVLSAGSHPGRAALAAPGGRLRSRPSMSDTGRAPGRPRALAHRRAPVGALAALGAALPKSARSRDWDTSDQEDVDDRTPSAQSRG
jgi:hypothetical protein